MQIHPHFLTLSQILNLAPEATTDLYTTLHTHYTAKNRHYHNLTHILTVLDTIQQLTPTPSPALQLAAWYHDIIYDTRKKDNEAQSAEAMLAQLAPLDVEATILEQASELIRATASHTPTDNPDSPLLLDADLAILASPRKEYKQYSSEIRKEYGWVPRPAYRNGRKKVLTSFLNRPQLYFTPAMQAKEALARENLGWEIGQL